MVFGLFRQKKHNRIIVDRQYAVLSSTARDPHFYTDLDVPDTVMGRFEMFCVIMILYFRRTRRSQASGKAVAQAIVDAFFQDIDYSIRELGIGDPGVPKRMKKLASMFYGRLESYGAALENADGELLATALRRNIYPQPEAGAPAMAALAGWMISTDAALAVIGEDLVETGAVAIPVPGGTN